MNDYHMGEDGNAVAHYFEQCRLRAYPDPGSELAKALRVGKPLGPHLRGDPWTIGWGDTGPDVYEGLEITQEEADARYARRMAGEFEPGVRRAVRVPVDQKQFDALVSIFYNVGVETMSASTMVRLLNSGDYRGAAGQFPRWDKSKGAVLKGLQRRREAERLLFLGMDAEPAIAAALAKFP